MIDNRPLLDKQITLEILAKLIEVPVSHNPEQLLELILLDNALKGTSKPKSDPVAAHSYNNHTKEPVKHITKPVTDHSKIKVAKSTIDKVDMADNTSITPTSDIIDDNSGKKYFYH